MSYPPLPIAILAGTDREPIARGPRSARLTSINGCKALTTRFGTATLLDTVVETLKRTGLFGPIWIVGASAVYGHERHGVPVLDCSGNFSDSLGTALSAFLRLQRIDVPLAILASDINPTLAELHIAVNNYRLDQNVAFWYSIVPKVAFHTPLGPIAFKRSYHIRPAPHRATVEVLPGHLLIVNPRAISQSMLLAVSDLAYRARARPILRRLATLVPAVFCRLLRRQNRGPLDVPSLRRLLSLAYHAILLGLTVRLRIATLDSMANHFISLFTEPRPPLSPGRSHGSLGKIALLPTPSLAFDFDTVEDVHFAGGTTVPLGDVSHDR